MFEVQGYAVSRGSYDTSVSLGSLGFRLTIGEPIPVTLINESGIIDPDAPEATSLTIGDDEQGELESLEYRSFSRDSDSQTSYSFVRLAASNTAEYILLPIVPESGVLIKDPLPEGSDYVTGSLFNSVTVSLLANEPPVATGDTAETSEGSAVTPVNEPPVQRPRVPPVNTPPSTGDGSEIFNVSEVSERFDLGGGANRIQGLVENFFGDVFQQFGIDDEIIFFNTITRDSMSVTRGSAIIAIDTDGDGTSDGSFTLEGDYSSGDFMAVIQDQETLLTFETFLPILAEQQAVNPDLVTGIVNQTFLTGNGTQDMAIRLQDMGSTWNAEYDNVIGAYEITASGDIVDTKILFENANADKTASTILSGVEAGHRIGFFLVQDGAEWLASQGDRQEFSFINSSGNAANIRDGTSMALALNGVATDQIVFHSFDPGMNTDGVQHVLSGVVPGGQALSIGFEDFLGGGDRDYEDVVMKISFIDSLAT